MNFPDDKAPDHTEQLDPAFLDNPTWDPVTRQWGSSHIDPATGHRVSDESASSGRGAGVPLPGASAAGADTIAGPLTAEEIFAGGTAAGTGATALTIEEQLRRALQDPKKLAALLPLLMQAFGGGGGNNPFNDRAMTDEVTKSMALQRGRLEQTQPVFDTLVNMSYGSTPMQYRGAAPKGYTPNAPPQGAYQYQGPRFG